MRMTQFLENLDLGIEVILDLALELPQFDGFDCDSGAGTLRGTQKVSFNSTHSPGVRWGPREVRDNSPEPSYDQDKKHCHFWRVDKGTSYNRRGEGADLVGARVDRGEAALPDLGTDDPLAHGVGLGPRTPGSGGFRSHIFLGVLTRQEDSCGRRSPWA